MARSDLGRSVLRLMLERREDNIAELARLVFSLRLSQDVCLSLAKSGPADTQPALVS